MKYVAYSREDETFSEFLDQLKKQGPDVGLVSAQFSDLDDTRCRLVLDCLLGLWSQVAREPSMYGRSMPGVRYLDFSSNRIQSFQASGLVQILNNNRLLSALEIQANELGKAGTEDIRAFACAMKHCSLRRLNITANRLGDAGLATLIDHLPDTGTSLLALHLSVNTFSTDTGSWNAAHSIARFLSSPKKCRGLKSIHLNGNHFGWEGVRAIAHAIIGSRRACQATANSLVDVPSSILDACPPNTSLTNIDLFSTGIDSLNTASKNVPPCAEWEAYSTVSRENWYQLVMEQLEMNQYQQAVCQRAAARILGAARIIGCKSRWIEPPDGARDHFPFRRLPVELRRHILFHVDSEQCLSHEQLINVLRWASEPSTLGYVREAGAWPPTQSLAVADNVWNLPPWSWTECYECRSPPRNWYSDGLEYDELDGFDPAKMAFLECTGTVEMEHVASRA